ncbi:MAG: YbhB/YbcL family Raf kinase inhibitor-like protein [Ignavibacteriae bacterium]|nr:YbhB/YbcL family Raf kinase inhibitor-like protein [Ignavibacteriota bacterium]
MFTLQSLSYKNNEPIPTKHAHNSVVGGRNISPGFEWTNPPVTTKSFLLTIVDPHPVANNWVHWILANIPFNVRKIVEGASRSKSLPPGSKEMISSFNELGYGGPAPPRGSGTHPYVATLYALNIESIKVGVSTSLKQVLNMIEGKVIAEASVTGSYERK